MKTPSKFGPNHIFPISILLPYNKPIRNNSRFSPKPYSILIFGNWLMLSPLWNACFPFYLWQNRTQPVGLSSSLLSLKLSWLNFFPSQSDLLLSILFIPKVINSYHNITWLMVCFFRQMLSNSRIHCVLFFVFPAPNIVFSHSQHPINICWVVK